MGKNRLPTTGPGRPRGRKPWTALSADRTYLQRRGTRHAIPEKSDGRAAHLRKDLVAEGPCLPSGTAQAAKRYQVGVQSRHSAIQPARICGAVTAWAGTTRSRKTKPRQPLGGQLHVCRRPSSSLLHRQVPHTGFVQAAVKKPLAACEIPDHRNQSLTRAYWATPPLIPAVDNTATTCEISVTDHDEEVKSPCERYWLRARCRWLVCTACFLSLARAGSPGVQRTAARSNTGDFVWCGSLGVVCRGLVR